MTTTDMSPKLMATLAGATVVLVALIGWFALVSPQRSKADGLDTQIAAGRVALAAAESAARPGPVSKKQKPVGHLLAIALPSTLEMPSLLSQVQGLARTSKVSLVRFTPSAAIVLGSYESIPIDISVTGRYAQIRGFLHELRVHAGPTSQGGIHATGRLFSVESIGLTPGTVAPVLAATIRVDAFVFSGVPPAVPVAPAPASGTDTSAAATP